MVVSWPSQGMIKTYTCKASPAALCGQQVNQCYRRGDQQDYQNRQNRAGWFRTLEAFSDIIYLTVGDMDIPGQIPARFRAI